MSTALSASLVRDALREIFVAEIERRGGETTIEGKKGRIIASLDIAEVAPVRDVDGTETTLTLMRCDGWRYYSCRVGSYHASLAYLCGCDDGQVWAARVPGTVETVAEAHTWITPAVVRAAIDRGDTVKRQGDIYIIPCRNGQDGMARTSKGMAPHLWDAEKRMLRHPEHGSLAVAYPARCVPQRVYEMGRSGRRGDGD